MTKLEIYERELLLWQVSPRRRDMITGQRYYLGQHDICRRQRTAIGPSGELMPVSNLANNKVVDNQYAKHVDQKASYLLGQLIAFACDNTDYVQKVRKVLGKRFMRTLKYAGVECFNSGISWLYAFFNQSGTLDFKLFPGYEILPFWQDSAHTELDSALRFYKVEDTDKKLIQKADIFSSEGIQTFTLINGHLIADSPVQCYVSINGEGFNWSRLPLIAIRYNASEKPLICNVKALQDAINLIESDFVNNMQEDSGGSTILVLKNYDGQDLGEFRKNLAEYRAIKVRTYEGTAGEVDALTIEVNAENYKTILHLLKKALIENMRSFDAKNDRLNGTPNQLNIQSMYCDIDLDANSMQTELQSAFEDVLWFVNTYLYNIGAGDYYNEDISVIFNRDILINETEAIENCAKSVGIISDKTIISMHPWVDNPNVELERVKKQKETDDIYRTAFEQQYKKAAQSVQ